MEKVRRNSYFQTILVAVRKESSVVVASDRFEASWGLDVDTDSKIVLHSTLPLAVATAGLARLRDPRSGRDVGTTDYVGRIVTEVSQANELDFARLAARFANRLHPLVRETLKDPRIAADQRSMVELVIAFVRGTAAGMGVVRVGQRVETKAVETFLEAPEQLLTFYSQGQYASDQARFGLQLSDPAFVGNHLRRVVSEGIAYEASLHGGQNEECGTAIDVAIVNTKGARLV